MKVRVGLAVVATVAAAAAVVAVGGTGDAAAQAVVVPASAVDPATLAAAAVGRVPGAPIPASRTAAVLAAFSPYPAVEHFPVPPAAASHIPDVLAAVVGGDVL